MTAIHRRALLLSAAAPGIAMLGAAAARPARAADAVLRVGDQKGGSQALMQAAGVLDGLPYKLEWNQFAAAAPLLEALRARALDAAFAGDAPTTFALAAGLRGHIIVPVRTTGAGTALVVPANSPIKTVADLKGKRIATNTGSVGHALVLALAEREGWAPTDVHIQNLMPTDGKLALSAGAVDAWSTWGVYAAQARLVDKARVVADGSGGLTSGLSYLVASDQAIEAQHAALLDFCRRLAAAHRWAHGHAEEFAQAQSAATGVAAAVAKLNFETEQPTPVVVDPQVIADEQRTADRYLKAGLLRTHVAAADAFDASFSQALSG